jgi:transcriptional regulator with XRE-family HTH domain
MERELTPLAKWLAMECQARNLSWSEASRRAGLDRSTISTLMRGTHPGLETCKALAAFFGVPTEHVLRLAGHLDNAAAAEELPPEVLVLVREMEKLPRPMQRAAINAWRAILQGLSEAADQGAED